MAMNTLIGTHARGRTGYHSAHPVRGPGGIAKSKRLRKREAALFARQKNHAETINRIGHQHEAAYRKPGSMRP